MTPFADLGPAKECQLAQGTIRFRDVGAGPTLVFVHGVLVNGTLWREVVPPLARRFRCVVPDLPLGAHAHPLRPEAERNPVGIARLLADFLAALDLDDVILVGNDTGGAICQIAIAHHPERIAGLVLTNCDAYEAFFPWPLSPFHFGARYLGERFGELLVWVLRRRLGQRALVALVSRRRPDEATLDAYFGPFLRDPGVRYDLVRFVAAISKRDTLAAAETFPRFRHSVLIAWGENDPFFTKRLARRLAGGFPNAELRFLPRSRAFVPEDQPERLAELIADFVPDRVRAAA